MRRSDIAGGAISVVQEKTKTELVLPLHQSLPAALRAYPAKGIYLIGDKHGRPFRAAALSNFNQCAGYLLDRQPPGCACSWLDNLPFDLHRNRKRERRTFANIGLDPNAAAVHPDDALGD